MLFRKKMLIINCIYIILLIHIHEAFSLNNPLRKLIDITNDEIGMNDLLKSIVRTFIASNVSEKIFNLSLSDQCVSKLNGTYFLVDDFDGKSYRNQRRINKTLYYYSKLFLSSSKNKNDLGSPEKCETILYRHRRELILNDNLTHISVFLENGNSYYEDLKNNDNDNNFFSLCLVDGCEKDDYIKLIDFINTLLQDKYIDNFNEASINNDKKEDNTVNINENDNNKTFTVYNGHTIKNSFNNREISIFYMKKKTTKKSLYITILKFLPLILIIIHIIFVIINIIPKYLYKLIICIFCCKCKSQKKKGNIKIKRVLSKDKGQLISKESNNSINNISLSSSTLSTNIDKINETINLLFKIDKNFEGLMEYNKHNDIVNDSGCSYINGLRGISMIFFLFGNVFIAIYNSPIIEKNTKIFYHNFKNIFYFIFYVGIKYSPKILICCSGFTLFYKFVCFLDDKVESEKDIKRQRDEKKEKAENKNNKNDEYNEIKNINKNKGNEGGKNTGNRTFNFNSLIPVKYLCYFFGYQLHKYYIYLLIMFFFLFNLYESISFFHGVGPIWDFFNQKIVEPSNTKGKIIPLLFGFQGYFLSFIRNDKYNLQNYFNLAYQEIFYFIISTIFIFVGYKKNLRIDFYCKVSIGILFLVRFLYYFISGTNNRDYFSYQSYGQFYTSLIYNYIYYLLGIYLGMYNYVIQKRFTNLDCKKNKKIYLVHCVKVIEIIKRKKGFPIYIYIIFIFILLINIFLQQILIFIFELINNSITECITSYDKNILVGFIMSIDTDIVVLDINIIALFMYLRGDNPISDLINHNIWSVLNKLYFSFILLINPIILYVIYITETKIKFDINNCILYAFVSGILVFTLASILYSIFEIPYKKAIRYWFNFSEKEIINERFNNIENSFNDKQIEEKQADLLEDSNSDVEEYVEDEDDEDDDD